MKRTVLSFYLAKYYFPQNYLFLLQIEDKKHLSILNSQTHVKLFRVKNSISVYIYNFHFIFTYNEPYYKNESI